MVPSSVGGTSRSSSLILSAQALGSWLLVWSVIWTCLALVVGQKHWSSLFVLLSSTFWAYLMLISMDYQRSRFSSSRSVWWRCTNRTGWYFLLLRVYGKFGKAKEGCFQILNIVAWFMPWIAFGLDDFFLGCAGIGIVLMFVVGIFLHHPFWV